MKVLCCADLHLGRSSSLLKEGGDRRQLSAASAWLRLVETAIEKGADAVCIAGDVFDASPYESRQDFLRGLTRLKETNIPVVAVAGNHDSHSLARFALQHQDSGLIFLGRGGVWETHTLKTEKAQLEVVGWSFPEAYVTASSLAKLPPRKSPVPRLGLVHGDVSAGTLYHPLSPSDLQTASVDAWLLGHIHGSRSLAVGKALYPGSLQALDMGEVGVHGYYWLQVESGSVSFSPLIPFSSVHFAEIELESPEDEDPDIWLESKLVVLGGNLRADQPLLQSCQWRVKLTIPPGTEGPKIREPRELNLEDAFEVVSVTVKTKVDLAAHAERSDQAGALARLIMALESLPDSDSDLDEKSKHLASTAASRVQQTHNSAWSPFRRLESCPAQMDDETARNESVLLLKEAAMTKLKMLLDMGGEG